MSGSGQHAMSSSEDLRNASLEILVHRHAVVGLDPRSLGKIDQRFDADPGHDQVDLDRSGNVRELKNVIERAVILAKGSRLPLADVLPDAVSNGTAASSVGKVGQIFQASARRMCGLHMQHHYWKETSPLPTPRAQNHPRRSASHRSNISSWRRCCIYNSIPEGKLEKSMLSFLKREVTRQLRKKRCHLCGDLKPCR